MAVSTGRATFLTLQHVLQIILSAYGVRHSYVAITNLQKYEATTKKLAKFSQEAQDQLNKTRSTQATGALASLLSLMTALSLTLSPESFPSWARPATSTVMLAIALGSRYYIKGFWAPGAKDDKGKDKGTQVPLPNMEDYNLAVRKTEDLLKCLEYLEYSWLISALLGWTMGMA